MSSSERPPGGRARHGIRRGAERAGRAGARITRGLGEPALFAILLSSLVAGLFMVLGVVAGDALGLTPLAFLLAGVFFVITVATYVEGNSLHPERGGAATFARYAFDELWSFVAGWAILLDYLIVMAIGAVAITDYLAVFWSDLDDGLVEIVIGGLALTYVALQNVRGLSAERLGMVLRLSLFGLGLLVLVAAIAFAQEWDPGAITDSIELGSAPAWDDALFATVVAAVALTGVEAASGLAGEVRVGRRGLRRVVLVVSGVALLLFAGVSAAALMAVPVVGGETALGGRYLEAPVLGVVNTFEPAWLMDSSRYVIGATAAAILIVGMNGQMLGLARLSYSLATNRQIPSAAGRLSERRGTPYIAITLAAAIAFLLVIPHDVDFLAGIFAFGAMITISIAHVSVIVLRFRERDRPSAFRVPFSIPVGRGSIPLPALLGAVVSILAWVSVVALHEGARVVGGVWMAIGIAMYVIYRKAQDRPLTKRFTIPAEMLQEHTEAEYGSILVPVFGERTDDEIVGTAGRFASEHAEEGEGGAVLEALYVFEIPMSLPIDARVPEERIKRGQARARPRQGGGRGVRGRGGGHGDGARAHRRAGDRGRGAPARGGGDRAGGRGAQPRGRRRDPRRARAGARSLHRGDHPLRGREGALQGDSHRAPGG